MSQASGAIKEALEAGRNAVADQLVNLVISGGKFNIRPIIAAMVTAGLENKLDLKLGDQKAQGFGTRLVNLLITHNF